jgi:hypothetical protein
LAYGTVVWCLHPSITTTLLGLAAVRYFWLRRPRARIVQSSVRRLEGRQRRFGIAQVAVTGIWEAVQIWREAAAAAKRKDLHAIVQFVLVFLAGFMAFAMLGDVAVLWLVMNRGLLLLWICSQLNA